MLTQQSDESPERMEADGERSPSLLDIINAEVPMARPPENNSKPRSRSRGRSPTRRPATTVKPRPHSTSSRGRKGANAKSRYSSRSQSRNARPGETPRTDQAVGATNFKMPHPVDKNESERRDTASGSNPKAPEPAHPANLNRTFRENVQICLPHAPLSYIDLTVKH